MRGTFADGQRVTAARLARGYTQERLATLADLDVKTVRKAEQGKRLDIGTLSRLAAALDVELQCLVRENNSKSPDEFAMRAAIVRWLQTFDDQDIGGLLALYHDDALMDLPGDPNIPFGGRYQGKEQIRRGFLTTWATCRTVPDRVEDFSLHVSGDTILFRGVKGVYLPGGEAVRLPCTQIFTFKDGLIVEQRVEYDTLKFNQLLQFPPPAPPNG